MYNYRKYPMYGKKSTKIALLKIGTFFAMYGKNTMIFKF